jgi:hypothetical protein
LHAHLGEFVLPAGPDATEVDRLDAVKLLGGLLTASVGGAMMPALLKRPN